MSTLSDKTSTIDVETKGCLSQIDNKVNELKSNFSSQEKMSKHLCENLDRVSKNLVNFRDKSLRDSSKFETEIREIGEVSKSLVELTSEALPRMEAGLSEHWNCIEGLSANVNTIDETLGKNI